MEPYKLIYYLMGVLAVAAYVYRSKIKLFFINRAQYKAQKALYQQDIELCEKLSNELKDYILSVPEIIKANKDTFYEPGDWPLVATAFQQFESVRSPYREKLANVKAAADRIRASSKKDLSFENEYKLFMSELNLQIIEYPYLANYRGKMFGLLKPDVQNNSEIKQTAENIFSLANEIFVAGRKRGGYFSQLYEDYSRYVTLYVSEASKTLRRLRFDDKAQALEGLLTIN